MGLLEDLGELEYQYHQQSSELKHWRAVQSSWGPLSRSIADGEPLPTIAYSELYPNLPPSDTRRRVVFYKNMGEEERLRIFMKPREESLHRQQIRAKISSLEMNINNLVQQIANLTETNIREGSLHAALQQASR